MITQDELLHLALEEGLTRDQVITALSALRENNERYLSRRRRHGHRTETDAFLGQREGALALSVAWLRQQQKGEGPKGLSDQQDPHHFTASSPTSSSDVTIDEVGDDG